MKKIIFIIIFLLVFSSLFLACNSRTQEDSDKEGELSTTELSYMIDDVEKCAVITGRGSCSDLRIVIPKNIGGYLVTEIASNAFANDLMKSVSIPDSVKSIGNDAFNSCFALEAVYITDIAKWCAISFGDGDATPLYYAKKLYLNGNLVTDLVIPDTVISVKDYAFLGCRSLKSLTIPNSVMSIRDKAFGYCSKLTSVTIGDSVMSIGDYAFEGCTSLTSINIPGSVTWIGDYAFDCCTSLTRITIGNSVTSIGQYAFYYCTSLTSVTIGNSVTSIGSNAFYHCTSLTSVTIGKSVTSIGYDAFYDCTSLTNVTFTNTSGWYSTKTYGASSGWDMTVTNPSTNATNLKSNYCLYYWYRK